jgi:hypothetical protein
MSEEPMNNKIVKNDRTEDRVQTCVFCNIISANGSNILEPRVNYYLFIIINFVLH